MQFERFRAAPCGLLQHIRCLLQIALLEQDLSLPALDFNRVRKGALAIANGLNSGIAGTKRTITWSFLNAPLVCLGAMNRNRWDPYWHDSYRPQNAHLYSYMMSNIWNCNYPLYQGGECSFAYAFRTHDFTSTESYSFRFGWEMHHPPEAVWADEHQPVTPSCRRSNRTMLR